MATTAIVDASLWWEPFSALLTEFEDASVASELPQPLEATLKDNHTWFLHTITQFKSPDQKSREALGSSRVKIGQHELNIQPELKETALKISSILGLDEVQSYVLVKRSMEHTNSTHSDPQQDILNLAILEYYIERQCLLKCTRQILMHALYYGSQPGGSVVLEEAHRLISDGLEGKVLSIFQSLLSSNYPEQMDVDLYVLWAEEILNEDNLILDILFLIYYESFSTCDAKSWRKLCELYEGIITGSYNFQKLTISPDAIRAIYHAKVQLLLILIEALNLEILLQMIHDNIPFRQGSMGFSEIDVQQIDTTISIINTYQAPEAGPLILAWAVFLCLISSLPRKENNNVLMEMDHIGYVRQAFEASSLGYFREILHSDTLKYSDGPVAGYRSVLRTFISAFIASYEINLQFEDDNLKLILDILGKIYRGEESLCIQFWDRDSFIDGPVRCLLCNLEGEFPFKIAEFVSLLSALCEGSWPSECVFNFLDKSVGLSTVLELSSDSVVDPVSKIVETRSPLHAAGIEGLIIPAQSRGQVLRMIDISHALVRWEFSESGVLVLLLHLAQDVYSQNSEELIVILDLLSRLVTFNTAVCYSLLDAGKSFHDEEFTKGKQENYVRVRVVEIVCALLKSLSPSLKGVVMMSMGINILTKMMRCLPSHVALMAMKGNIFDVALKTNPFGGGSDNLSSGSWLLSGRLAKMLLIDCEQSDCSMTLSVLDFTINLLDTGLETDGVLALVVFSLQYVLVNHEHWKYKVNSARWRVTLKVLEAVKKCTCSISHCTKLGESIHDIMLSDPAINSALFRIVCTTTPSLEKIIVSRLFDTLDLEGLQLAIASGLDVLISMLFAFSKDTSGLPVFHQAILSPKTKPVPVINAAISLMSYFRNAEIQVGAMRLLYMLFAADFSETYNACLGLDDKQVVNFQKTVCSILSKSKQSPCSEDLSIATWKLLTSAARNQPAFLTAVIMSKEYLNAQVLDTNSEHQPNKTENGSPDSRDASLLNEILQFLRNSEDLAHSKPNIFLCLLNFMRTLWQGAPQFTRMLEQLKVSDKFWRYITNPVVLITSNKGKISELTVKELRNKAYKYQFLSDAIDIIGYEVFLQKKLAHAELIVNRTTKPTNGSEKVEDSKLAKGESFSSLKEIISTWCKSSLLGDLIEECVSWEFDKSNLLHARIAAALFAVSAMVRLKSGNSGSLAVSLVERIVTLSQKLCKLPAFSELLAQYKKGCYSEGPELENLILSDLFYLIQGELEGRPIDNKPFKELMQFLIESNFIDAYKSKQDDDLLAEVNNVYLHDTVWLRADLGLEMWDLSAWKESKDVAESMLLCLQDANSKILYSNAKLSALRGLSTLLNMHENSLEEGEALTGLKISEQLVSSCIDHVCQCLHDTVKSLAPAPDADEDLLNILTAQAELLLILVRSSSNISQTACVLILKTSGYGLKVLCGRRPSLATGTATKLFLLLILGLNDSVTLGLNTVAGSGTEPVEYSSETSNSTLGLLPVLCSCIEFPDHLILSLAAIDSILKGLASADTWFPVIQKHLPMQLIIQKIQDPTSSKTVSVILKFLLNLARVRLGAEMLLNAGILSSLKISVSEVSEGESLSTIQCEKIFTLPKKTPNWGLSLAVLTAIIRSLRDGSSSLSVVDYALACILVEKAPLVSYYISAPDFPTDGHESKRARALKSNISLTDLEETHNTLSFICVLARHWNSWKKVMQSTESPLREKCIHLLAFISRATQRPGESTKRVAPLVCCPVLKEEFDLYKSPSFINSKHGWFSLAALGCNSNPNIALATSKTVTTLSLRDQSNINGDLSPQSRLSDSIAIKMYEIAFLLLKFLCLQAESAAQKAEEVGFVDLANFPELPMPEILHGLQDQGIAIVTELCEANKTKQVAKEVQEVCLLLLQITVMALYLEFCVIQICGIRPVLGHVETFSRELRLLSRASEGHAFLKEGLKTLKQIVSFVYPELIQQDALF